jgi:tetratricopeptide (TPR) repeat protein
MELSCVETAREILLANNETYLANALLAKELQKNHHDIDKLFSLGTGYLKAKNFESALSCFAELKRLTNSFESHYYAAKSHEGLNQDELAKNCYLDALLITTNNMDLLFEAYKNVGNLYLKARNLDLAEDFYHKAYNLQPESPQLMVNLGTLEMQKTDSSRAIERFRKALTLDPKFAPAWVGLALCYHQFGDHDMAWASVLKSLDCDSFNSTALLLMAQWCGKQSAMDIAIQKLMAFFDRGEFDSMLSLCFVELCIQTNQFFLARIELERSLLWDPQHTDLLNFDRALSDHGY